MGNTGFEPVTPSVWYQKDKFDKNPSLDFSVSYMALFAYFIRENIYSLIFFNFILLHGNGQVLLTQVLTLKIMPKKQITNKLYRYCLQNLNQDIVIMIYDGSMDISNITIIF